MPYEATRKILRKARQQLWLQGLIDRGSLGLLLAACVLATCAGLHILQGPVSLTWWLPAALLAVAAPVLMAAPDIPSPGAAAAELDHWLQTRGLFSAAWFVNSQTAASATTSVVVLEQAELVATARVNQLPGLKNPLPPVRLGITVTIAAVSLFLLSLQGAVPEAQSNVPSASAQVVRNEAQADQWVSALENMSTAGDDPAARDRQALRDASRDFTSNSGSPRHGRGPDAPPAEPSELSSDDRSSARLLLPGQGQNVGRVASMEPSRGIAADHYRESNDVPDELHILNVARKPVAQTTAVDHVRSVGLLPVEGAFQGPQARAHPAAAAQPVNEPFAPILGPAYRALQFRYFNGATNGD